MRPPASREGSYQPGERSFAGAPGTFVHIPPGQLHGFGAILSTEPLRILMVQSPAEASAALLRAMSQAASCTDMAEAMAILATVDMVPYRLSPMRRLSGRAR